MAAMFRRPRPGGGGHPPPLAPTVNSFKPRAQWSNTESSVFLYVNLPGFYIDQIKINKDERTRSIQIQGERRLSSYTKARFSETYRVPEACDMSKLVTSFSHGLLSIEFPKVVEGEKQDQGKNVQKPNQEKQQVGTSQEKASPPMVNEQEPKTYKSVLEGKRTVPTGRSQEKFEQKMKEGEASPSLARKERVKEERVIERKEDAKKGQHKSVQKPEEEKGRSTPNISGSLNPKVRAKEDEVIKRTDIGQEKTGQKVKESDGRLDPKVHAKAGKGDGGIGQTLREEAKIGLEQKKTQKYATPVVEDEARRTEKETAAANRGKPELKTKERGERIVRDVNGNGKSNNDGDKVSDEEKERKLEEAGLVKETRHVKEVVESEKVARRGEDRMKMVDKSLESERGLLLPQEQRKADMDPLAVGAGRTNLEESQKYDKSLVNVGVAALVIMVFGAYAFVPLIKFFIS